MRYHTWMVGLVACASFSVAIALAAGADEPSPATKPVASAPASGPATQPADAKTVAELISRLASENFAFREEATKRLIEMGESVRPFMEEALKDKSLDLEAITRIKTVLARTAKAPTEARTVTDKATGITVSLDDAGTSVSASQNGKMLWKFQGGMAATALKIVNGQVVALPGNWVIDLATGKMISMGP